MNTQLIQIELDKITNSSFAKKTDKQLEAYESLSIYLKQKFNGLQPKSLVQYNLSGRKWTKLTHESVVEIRRKYKPNNYGKKRLAKEYGVSVTLIHMIIHKKKWKNIKQLPKLTVAS